MKNKVTNRTISKIVLAGLLLSTAPVTLSMNDQDLSATEKQQRMVNQEIAQIETAVNKLRKLKKWIPIILAGVGIAAVLGTAFVSTLLLKRRKKIMRKFKDFMVPLKEAIEDKLSGIKLADADTLKEVNNLIITQFKKIDKIDIIMQKIKANKKLTKYHDILKKDRKTFKKYWNMLANPETTTRSPKALRTKKEDISKNIKETLQKIVVIMEEKKGLVQFKKRTRLFHPKAFLAAGLGGLVLALGTAFGTLAGIIATFIGFKKAQALKAFEGARKLEQMEKQNPGILNERAQGIIKDLKELGRNRMVKGYIKGLQIKGTMAATVSTLPTLVAKLGRKKLAKYIKWRWEVTDLQKLIKEEAEHPIDIEGLMPAWSETLKKAQSGLIKLEDKIKKLEKKHPDLKMLSEKAVRDYTTKVNSILKDLEEPEPVGPQEKKEMPVIDL